MEDKSLFNSSQPPTISEGLQNFIDAMVEEIVLEGKPFDTQKKYLKKFSENEGLDYEALEKGITELVETMREMKSSDSQTLMRLALFQARECHVTETQIQRLAEQLKAQKASRPDTTLFRAKENGLYGMIDVEGNMVVEPRFESMDECFCDGLALVTLNGKEGYIDKTGRIAIEPRFDEANQFSDGVAIVKIGDESFLIDQTGNRITKALQFDDIAYSFDEGLCRVKIDDKYGFIDKSGSLVIRPQFVEADYFHEGLAQVQMGSYDEVEKMRYGFIDTTGRVVFERGNKMGKWPGHFKEGLLAADVLVEKIQKVRKGLFRTEEYKSLERKYGYVDINGKTAIDYRFDLANPFSNGLARVEVGNQVGYINKLGEMVISPRYVFADDFCEGLAGVKIDGLWGYIDKSGNMVIEPKYDSVSEFSEGLAKVTIEGKQGFIDKSGNMVISPRFCYAEGFYDGLCHVTWDEDFDQQGYINRSGKVVFKES